MYEKILLLHEKLARSLQELKDVNTFHIDLAGLLKEIQYSQMPLSEIYQDKIGIFLDSISRFSKTLK